MPPKRRSSPEGVEGKEHWLPSKEPARSRPWAYEELLFGSSLERKRMKELGVVMDELDGERAELARLHQELDEHLASITSLEKRLNELTPVPAEAEPTAAVSARSLPAARAPRRVEHNPPADRSYALARCEGFEVESPDGPVGFVEGLRFVSRIDQPDLLEVRGGRFGRELLLIPIEAVEQVSSAERLVVVRGAPNVSGDLFGELVGRLRRALRFDHAAS